MSTIDCLQDRKVSLIPQGITMGHRAKGHTAAYAICRMRAARAISGDC